MHNLSGDPHILMNRSILADLKMHISAENVAQFNAVMRKMNLAFFHSLHIVFACVMIAAVIALVVSMFLKDVPLRRRHPDDVL